MNDIYTPENFIQDNSPDGEFLQSEEWRKFQESVGRKTFHVELKSPSSPPFEKGEDICFWANIIEHSLPFVGKYFYISRGPICHPERAERVEGSNEFNKLDSSITLGMTELINLAKENKAGWIRIEPENKEILEIIKKNVGARFIEPKTGRFNKLNCYKSYKIKKAPHDMQSREILIMDIAKPEEELLAEMKAKTRYNIKLAQKHGVSVRVVANNCHPEIVSGSQEMLKQVQHDTKCYINEFIKLVKITAKRDRITSHPDSYYRKMFETIPADILKLYIAEYKDKVIAANLMIFYGKTATYLHGASDNSHRNLMAPYLLQWQAIKDTKAAGYTYYDLGGIHTKTGEGITKFKTGFTPNIKPVKFPGSYDIILNPVRYYLYKVIQKIKSIL